MRFLELKFPKFLQALLVVPLFYFFLIISLLASSGVPAFAEGTSCAAKLQPTFTGSQAIKLCSTFGSAIAQSLIPSADNTYDLGSVAKSWRDLYLDRNALIGGTLGLSGLATIDADIAFVGTQALRHSTTGASNTQYVNISAGNSASVAQGAYIQLASTNAGGDLLLGSGTGGTIDLYNPTGNLAWSIDSAITQNATNGGDFVQTKAGTSVAQAVATSLAAAGTTTSDATVLTKVVSSVPTGATNSGVRLWNASIGSVLYVENQTGNTIKVYPHTGGFIGPNPGTTDGASTLATGRMGIYTKITSTGWLGYFATVLP